MIDDLDYATDPASGLVAPLDRSAPVWIAGHRGLVGSAVWRQLEKQGFTRLLGRTSSELDLTNRDAAFDFVATQRPKAVVMAAAHVGGIIANNTYPAEFISRNLQIQVNVMDAAAQYEVERLLFLGSSCIYPKFAPQPIKERDLHTGRLETTNESYALAKLAGIAQVRAIRKQYWLPWIAAMPCNVYGPGDNFSEEGSHVLSALIRRFSQAVLDGAKSVTNWGTGSPRREFLHADDLASACLYLLDHYNGPSPINVGTGVDHSIAELSAMVAEAAGYHGGVYWDHSKPDGTPRKLLDVSLLNEMGWKSSIDIVTGIGATLDWYQKTQKTRSEIRC